MTGIHGLGSSVIDYVMFEILVTNQIVTLDILNYHDLDSDHRPLTLTLKFSMPMSTIEENSKNQTKLHFDKSKVDIFLNDLNSELHILPYKDIIDYLYHNFTTSLYTSINKFTFEISFKNKNITTNPWYDREFKIARKVVRDASNEFFKLKRINTYKSIINRKESTI
jgi:hypothetical protein